ncbi:MAG: PKD domain-containing protein [Bacteroidales bacterium]|nr:PKD domain-containing protein [Bacteroidales bacterium]
MKVKATFFQFNSLLLLFLLILLACEKEYKNNESPTCKITSPTVDQEIIHGEIFKVKVDAYDKDGVITEVNFFIDNIKKGSSTSPPYVFEWNTSEVSMNVHKIKASSFDNSGLSALDEVYVTVIYSGAPRAPEAIFNNDVINGVIPLIVQFNDQSKYEPTSWHWDFGDMGTSTLQNPSYTYNNSGTYTVTLTVSNELGSDILTKKDYIYVGSGGGGESCPGIPTVTDVEGNTYKTVKIGEQCWMKENLRVGTQIESWDNMSNNGVIEKYCYDNDSVNCLVYGGLYQWDEIMQYSEEPGLQGICPEGWHIPTDTDWSNLISYLDGPDHAGGQMKEEGLIHWISPNSLASNSSGFTALPAGYRLIHGTTYNLYENTLFWSSSTIDSEVWYRGLYYSNAEVYRYTIKKDYGFSVRCIMDK